MTAKPMLQRGDSIPHFEVKTIGGELFSYSSIWQRRNLVLLAIPATEFEAPETYISQVEARRPEFTAKDKCRRMGFGNGRIEHENRSDDPSRAQEFHGGNGARISRFRKNDATRLCRRACPNGFDETGRHEQRTAAPLAATQLLPQRGRDRRMHQIGHVAAESSDLSHEARADVRGIQ